LIKEKKVIGANKAEVLKAKESSIELPRTLDTKENNYK
jgi:hypothetical protein